MPLSDWQFASGTMVHRLESGLLYSGFGQLLVAKPDPKGCDANLWAVLKSAADQLHLGLHINSLTTGQHAPGSRHTTGRAADINHIGPVGSALPQATAQNPHALRLVALLRENGWQPHEGGPFPGLMLGPAHSANNQTAVDHSSHLHVSIAARPGVGAGSVEEQEPEDSCEPDEGFISEGVQEQDKNRGDSASALRRGARVPLVLRPQPCTISTLLLRRAAA